MNLGLIVGGCSVLAGIAAALYFKRGSIMPGNGTSTPGNSGDKPEDKLSPVRAQILSWLSEVVPSTYGDQKFSKIAPGYKPDDPKLPKGFTTCGYLPLYIGNKLKAKDGITRGGLEQMRIAGKAAGSWVEAGGDKRPKPGDLFGIDSAARNLIVHVGVIVSATGEAWRTADAGQGSPMLQQAAYVDRKYDASAVTLGGPAGARPLAGWIDIEKHLASIGLNS